MDDLKTKPGQQRSLHECNVLARDIDRKNRDALADIADGVSRAIKARGKEAKRVQKPLRASPSEGKGKKAEA